MSSPEIPIVARQLQTLRSAAGWCPISDIGWIGVRGADRVRWLNGMATNSVQALTPGDGCYSFFLNAQGRIQGDATIWAAEDQLLLETDATQVPVLMELLDRYIIMDDVELQNLFAAMHGIKLAGTGTISSLNAAGFDVRASRLLKRQKVRWQGHEVVVQHCYSPFISRLEIWAESAEVIRNIQDALTREGVEPVSDAAFELLRIVEATPKYGVDIKDRDLPQETGQNRALHFAKGCYLGQEIVERIRSRGNVHRTFAQFAVHGDVPAPGTPIQAEGKPVGELTSIAAEITENTWLALGYIRREVLDRGLPLLYPGGSVEAVPPTTASNP